MQRQSNTRGKRHGSDRTKERTPAWPSQSFHPVLPEVRERLERAYRILTTNGFLVVADPVNPLSDGKTWVVKCHPTAKLPKDADAANLARQCLESANVKVDVVVRKEPMNEHERAKLGTLDEKERAELLHELYDFDLAEFMEEPGSIESRIRKDLKRAREAMRRATQAPGVTPSTTVGGKSQERMSVVKPILNEKGWSDLDWASHAGVDYHTVVNYRAGKRSYASTRKKLAQSLGLRTEQLPD